MIRGAGGFFVSGSKEDEKLGQCRTCRLLKNCELIDAKVRQKLFNPELEVPEYIMEYRNSCILYKLATFSYDEGTKYVSDGLPAHYKINITNRTDGFSIETDTVDLWEPCQPVYISAPTSSGKNTFIEEILFSYVKTINRKNNLKKKVLVISNRKALQAQMEDRIKGGIYSKEFDPNFICPYPKFQDVADVMLYQGISNIRNQRRLEQEQRNIISNYLFVICDEAHFFTSDSSFNPYTEKTLEAIVQIFKKSIRIYMTATPYDCLEYIENVESEKNYDENDNEGTNKLISSKRKDISPKPGVCYHFKRNYDYLDTKYYTDNDELKEFIIGSNEKWLIFIDNINLCNKFKEELVEDGMKEVEVLVINANSKSNSTYQNMIVKEQFVEKIRVVIATSVIDNGVNLRGVHNVVLSDVLRVKCLQMLGRARSDDSDKRITLYLKRFDKDFIGKRLNSQEEQADAYNDYGAAYLQESSNPGNKLAFLSKYYDKQLRDWEHAKLWFGRDANEPERVFPNEIARSLVNRSISIYESILNEMKENDGEREVPGQEYLEHQLSWFGKTYERDNDITLVNTKEIERRKIEEGKEALSDFLDLHVGNPILKPNQDKFGKSYAALYDSKFNKWNPNQDTYGTKIINNTLKHWNLPYHLYHKDKDLKTGTILWEVIKLNDGSDESYDERVEEAIEELKVHRKQQR